MFNSIVGIECSRPFVISSPFSYPRTICQHSALAFKSLSDIIRPLLTVRLLATEITPNLTPPRPAYNIRSAPLVPVIKPAGIHASRAVTEATAAAVG